jgi:hypothetical protein
MGTFESRKIFTETACLALGNHLLYVASRCVQRFKTGEGVNGASAATLGLQRVLHGSADPLALGDAGALGGFRNAGIEFFRHQYLKAMTHMLMLTDSFAKLTLKWN